MRTIAFVLVTIFALSACGSPSGQRGTTQYRYEQPADSAFSPKERALINEVCPEPTGGEKFSRSMELLGAQQQGGAAMREVKQRHLQEDIARQECILRVLGK